MRVQPLICAGRCVLSVTLTNCDRGYARRRHTLAPCWSLGATMPTPEQPGRMVLHFVWCDQLPRNLTGELHKLLNSWPTSGIYTESTRRHFQDSPLLKHPPMPNLTLLRFSCQAGNASTGLAETCLPPGDGGRWRPVGNGNLLRKGFHTGSYGSLHSWLVGCRVSLFDPDAPFRPCAYVQKPQLSATRLADSLV